MKKIFVLPILVFCAIGSFSQNLDSAYIYYNHFDFDKTLLELEKIPDPEKSEKSLWLKGRTLKKLNRFSQAIDCFKLIMQKDTQNIAALLETAHCYEKLNQFGYAINLYEKALEKAPSNIYFQQQLASCYYQNENYLVAKQHYLQLFRADSSLFNAKRLARSYDKLNQPDSAIRYYYFAFFSNPYDSYTAYYLASALKSKGEYSKGAGIAEGYLLHDSTNSKICRLAASLRFQEKAYLHSTSLFEKCVSLGDSSEYVWKYLGYSYYKLEEFDNAYKALKNAFVTDSFNVDICYALGIACKESGREQDAVEYLSKCIDLVTPSPGYLAKLCQDLAEAYTGNFDPQAAIKAYLAALDYTPTDTFLVYKIASHYENQLHNKPQALSYYEQFLSMRPKRPVNKEGDREKGININYFDFVERKVGELKEELFWEGNQDKINKEK